MQIAVLNDYQNAALSTAAWNSLISDTCLCVFHDTLRDEAAPAQRLRPFEIIVVTRERTAFPKSLFERPPYPGHLVTSGMRNAAIDLTAAAGSHVAVCARICWLSGFESGIYVPVGTIAVRILSGRAGAEWN